MKKLTYILTGSVFLGAQILALDLGIAKLSLYRLMLIIITGLTVLLFFKNDNRLIFSNNMISKNYTRFYLFWLIYALVSVIWIQDLAGWLKAVFFIGCGFLSIFYLSTFIRQEKDLKGIFNTLFAMTLLHNIIGWIEIICGIYFFADLDKLDKYRTFATQPSTRIPISIYANQNDYATMLIAGIALVFILFLNSKKLELKVLYLLTIFSSIFLLFRTDSRANTIALAVGIVSLLIIKYSKVFSIRNIAKLGLFTLLTATLVIIVSPSLHQRIGSLLDELQAVLFVDGNSNMTRVNLIKNGFVFLVQTLGLGTGAGNIEHWMRENPIFNIGTITNMHNWWMEILTGYGIVIFFLYIFMYITMMNQLYRNYKYTTNQFIKNTSWIFLAYMVSFVVASISSASNIFIEWQWVFWGIIIAFLRYCERYAKKNTNNIVKHRTSKKEYRENRMLGGEQWIQKL